MATATEKRLDRERALATLEEYRQEVESGNALFLISTEYGKGETDFLRVQIVYTEDDKEKDKSKTEISHLTWHTAKAFGYRLRDRNGGRWYIAMGGGGYSKSYEIALALADFYGVEQIRYNEM